MTKPFQTRTLDSNGYKRRAACICLRDSDRNHSLLVSSSRFVDRWVIPGGGVEPNEEESQAAIRELEEEAGLKGEVIASLGIFYNEERRHRTEVFVVNVLEEMTDWPELAKRTRKWMHLDEIRTHLAIHKPFQCEYIEKFKSIHSFDHSNKTSKHINT